VHALAHLVGNAFVTIAAGGSTVARETRVHDEAASTHRRAERAASTSCVVILEMARLDVRPGEAEAFESAFAEAQAIVAGMPGYRWHALQRCIEDPQRYLLLIAWDTLDDHIVGFRGSAGYQRWRQLLHHFYDPLPTVEHFVACPSLSSRASLGP
jgi:heme-degrading monooxygenase HmoA